MKKGDYIFMGAYSLQAVMAWGVVKRSAIFTRKIATRRRDLSHTTRLIIFSYVGFCTVYSVAFFVVNSGKKRCDIIASALKVIVSF